VIWWDNSKRAFRFSEAVMARLNAVSLCDFSNRFSLFSGSLRPVFLPRLER
jgi:hypothetical protein